MLVVVAIATHWPLVRDFRTKFWADGGDGAAFLWNYATIPSQLAAGRNPFRTSDIFYPVGIHTAFNTNTPLWSVASWPVQRLFGLPTVSVLIAMSALVLSGIGAYLLVRHLGCRRIVAVFAGVAFMLLPWRANRLVTHLNLIHTEFLPFALLALLALYDRQTRRRSLALGLVIGGALLTDLTVALLVVLALGAVVVSRPRASLQWPFLSALALAAGVAIVSSLPILVPLAQDLAAGEVTAPPGLGGAEGYSADVLSWVLPHPHHPLWGAPFQSRYDAVSGGERFSYIGVVVPVLAVVGVWLGGRKKRLWLGMTTAFVLLSFGPGLHVNGRTGSLFAYYGFRFSVPMPFLLLHQIPGMAGFRAPARFASVAGLAFVVLAAIGLEHVCRRWPRRVLALPLVAVVAVTADYLPPTSYLASLTIGDTVDAAYAEMAEDPHPGAVLDIPLQFRSGYGPLGDSYRGPTDHSQYMYFALVHGRPMSGGSVSRIPDTRLDALQGVAAYRQILALQGDYGPDEIAPATFTTDDLRALGIRFIVVHLESPFPRVEEHIETLGLVEFARSKHVVVWAIPPASP